LTGWLEMHLHPSLSIPSSTSHFALQQVAAARAWQRMGARLEDTMDGPDPPSAACVLDSSPRCTIDCVKPASHRSTLMPAAQSISINTKAHSFQHGTGHLAHQALVPDCKSSPYRTQKTSVTYLMGASQSWPLLRRPSTSP
jgi:hypothetical protein